MLRDCRGQKCFAELLRCQISAEKCSSIRRCRVRAGCPALRATTRRFLGSCCPAEGRPVGDCPPSHHETFRASGPARHPGSRSSGERPRRLNECSRSAPPLSVKSGAAPRLSEEENGSISPLDVDRITHFLRAEVASSRRSASLVNIAPTRWIWSSASCQRFCSIASRTPGIVLTP